MDIEQIITDFNNSLLDLVLNIADICPNSILGINKKSIEKEILKEENKRKFIDLFVTKILKYKPKIDIGDETFFMEKIYDEDLDGNMILLNKVFELKSIWKQLRRENKDIVIKYMQILCELAQNYFIKITNL